MGIQFNGTDNRVDFENESFFDWDWGQAFSVACWMYVEPGATEAGGAFVVGKAGPPGWALDMNLPVGEDPTFSLHLISSPGQEIWKYGPDQAWKRGAWAHCAATYDGSSTLAGVNLYLNGLLVGGGGGTDIDTPGGSLLNNFPLSVGGVGGGTSEFTDVAVSNAILEKRVWSATEIERLADIRNFNKNQSQLLNGSAYWWARLSSTSDLLDYSGYSNDGSLVGSPSTLADPTIIYVGTRGFGSFSGTTDTISFNTTADILPGQRVVLSDSHYNQHGNLVSVVFGSSLLSLSLDKRQVLGTLPVNCEIWSGIADALIPSGTTVVATYQISTANEGMIALDCFDGIKSPDYLDRTAGAFNESSVTTFDSGTTLATTQADEIAYAVFAFGTSLNTPLVTPETGWIETGEALNANLHIESAFKFLTATGTQRHQPTSSEAQAYAGAIVTYRAGPLNNADIAWMKG